ncbi:hypothetical protein, partial [Salmonella sp. SAL4449]|uniref:hypothetical protein n=1 Tax=Salmonella sp. SAL4449 TaxID=3159904 RepID=UPI00397D42EB
VRQYDAAITQVGAGLSVVLTGARFGTAAGGESSSFYGRVDRSTVSLDLSNLGHCELGTNHTVVEMLDNGFLNISGVGE